MHGELIGLSDEGRYNGKYCDDPRNTLEHIFVVRSVK